MNAARHKVPDDPRRVQALIEALRDDDEGARDAAVGPLIEALEDAETEVRQAAVSCLEYIGDARAVEPLIEVLADETERTRGGATLGLKGAGHDAVPALMEALGRHPHAHVRELAAFTLGNIGDRRARDASKKASGDFEVSE